MKRRNRSHRKLFTLLRLERLRLGMHPNLSLRNAASHSDTHIHTHMKIDLNMQSYTLSTNRERDERLVEFTAQKSPLLMLALWQLYV